VVAVVDVAVAVRRPPSDQQWRTYVVAAENVLDAELLACQWAAASSVMPTRSRVVAVVVK
jgi:hypothetical protein